MTFVLVHGGGLAADCWDPLVPFLDGPVHAVDLPGRGSRPADLSTVTQADFVAAVIDELVSRDLRDVVLVGHSMAGITLPAVVARQGDRIRHAVFVSCSIPPDGSTIADELASLSPATAEVAARIGDGVVSEDGSLHPDLATAMFCNDMDEETARHTLGLLVPEAPGLIVEPLAMPPMGDVPCTYVRLLRDASLTLDTQDRMVANLPGADVVDLDAGHMAMISRPDALAAILNRVGGER